MYRLFVFVLVSLLVLICIQRVGAHTSPEEIIDMQNVVNARFIVENRCEYTVYLKNKPIAIKLGGLWLGTGFFIEKEGEPHTALTASHVIECEPAVPDELLGKDLSKDDITSYEVKSTVFAVFEGKRYNALIIGKGHNGLGELDAAVLNIILPKDIPHYHIPVMRDYNAYGIKSSVTVIGFIPEIGIWRTKSAVIEEFSGDLMRVSTGVCGGMSGGPVMIWQDGKHRAIGIVIATFVGQKCGLIDTAVITRLTKALMEKIDGKIAPK